MQVAVPHRLILGHRFDAQIVALRKQRVFLVNSSFTQFVLPLPCAFLREQGFLSHFLVQRVERRVLDVLFELGFAKHVRFFGAHLFIGLSLLFLVLCAFV